MRIAFCVFVIALSGCSASRVQLATPPSSDTSPERRLDYYKDHRPVGQHVELRGQKGAEVVMGAKLLLANGTEITHPEDLVVAVPPASRTALAAKRIAQARAEKLPFEIAAGAAIGGGAAVMFGTLMLGGAFDPLLGGAAGLALMGVGVIPVVIAGNIGHEMEESRNQAFRHFDADLQAKLGLRVSTEVRATVSAAEPPSSLPPAQ